MEFQWRCQALVNGGVVFQLPGKFGNPIHLQLDNQYLVACYKFGEMLILVFDHVPL